LAAAPASASCGSRRSAEPARRFPALTRRVPGGSACGTTHSPSTWDWAAAGEALAIPAQCLPGFFYASPPNYLSLRDDLPARGFLAATFRSPRLPTAAAGLCHPRLTPSGLAGDGAPPAPVGPLAHPTGCRFQITVDPTAWHAYTLTWQGGNVIFEIDGPVWS